MQRLYDKIDNLNCKIDTQYRNFLTETSHALYEYDGSLPQDDDAADHFRAVKAVRIAYI